jgi:hypothetical protein
MFTGQGILSILGFVGPVTLPFAIIDITCTFHGICLSWIKPMFIHMVSFMGDVHHASLYMSPGRSCKTLDMYYALWSCYTIGLTIWNREIVSFIFMVDQSDERDSIHYVNSATEVQ